MSVLFLTATAQPEANLHSAWHLFSNKTQIDKIVVLTTDTTIANDQAKHLLALLPSLLSSFQLQVETLHLPDGIEEKSVDQIKAIVSEWIYKNKPHAVLFNITAGTKIIAIALDQVAQLSSRFECFYQSRDNHIIWYTRSGRQVYAIDPPDDIALRLKSRGINVTKTDTDLLKQPVEQLQYSLKMFEFFNQDFKKAQRLTTLINALASKVDRSAITLTQVVEKRANYVDLKDWLHDLATGNLTFFSFDFESDTLTWVSKDAADFMKGIWFEILVGYLVYGAVGDSVSTVHVNFEFENNGVRNETDVAFLSDSYLHFIECKTVSWKNKTTEPNEVLYKFNTISQVGGLNQRRSLVSLYEVSHEAKQRALLLDIQVFHGRDILKLNEFLKTSILGIGQ